MIKKQALIVMGDSETSQVLQTHLEHSAMETDCVQTLSKALGKR